MAQDTVETGEATEPEVPFTEQVVSAISELPSEQAKEFATQVMDGDIEGPFPTDQLMQHLIDAGYTPAKVAQALAVVGLRHGLKMAWWKAGQEAGLGTSGKSRSGGSGARSRYNAAIGKAGALGSVATATAPAVARARKQEAEEAPVRTFIKKGGGVYEDTETGEVIKGKKNLPSGYELVDAA